MARPSNPLRIVDLITDSAKAGCGDFVERLVQGWQDELFDFLHDRILLLDELLDPFKAEEIQTTDGRTTLDALLWNVGITDELDVLRQVLTSRQKRLLAAAAPELWQHKGLSRAWARVILALTGIPSWYESWFDLRTLTDTELDGWGDGTLATDCPDETTLWAKDPDDATTRAVVAQLVELGRPANERIRVRWVDALELWDRVRASSWWTNLSNRLSAADGTATLLAGATALWIEEGASFHDYVVQGWFEVQATTNDLAFFVHYNTPLRYFVVRLDLNASPQTATLGRRDGGAEVVVATQNLPWPVVAGVRYRFHVTVSLVPGTLPEERAVTMRLDGEAVVTGQGQGPASGHPGFQSVGLGAGSLILHRPMMAFDLPLEHEWVAPFGVTDDEP